MTIRRFKNANAFGFSLAIGFAMTSVFGATAALAFERSPVGADIPQIASTLYSREYPVQWIDDSPYSSFTWNTKSGPVQSYEYAEDMAPPVRVAASFRSLSWYPGEGAHTLTVWARSAAGILGTPATYRFKVVRGQAPDSPASLEDADTRSANPVISGLVSAGDGGAMDIRFYVSDDSGRAIGSTPYATIRGASGTRPGIEIPSELLKQGRKYTFQMQACAVVGSACSPMTPTRPLAVHSASPAPAANIAPSRPTNLGVPGSPETYIAGAESFWTARQSLAIGTSHLADDALSGRAQAAMVSGLLNAEAPTLDTIRALELVHGGVTKSAPTVEFTNPIVSTGADGVTVDVRLNIKESFVGTDLMGARNTTESARSAVFEFVPKNGVYSLERYFNASAIDGYAELGSSSVTAESTASTGAATPTANVLPEGPMTAPAKLSGPLAAGATTPFVAASAYSMNRSTMVSWAYAHYNDGWWYNPDCTAWASRALHEGAYLSYVAPGLYSNDHYWWRQTTVWPTSQTYSYVGAQHMANFLGYNSGSWLSYTYQAVPGDIIFYKYPGFSSINHTAVVTMTNPSTGELWMTQSDDNYMNTSLSDQQARIKASTGGYATIYIRHITM